MKLVMDTNIYSDFSDGLPDVVDRLATSSVHLFIPSIVLDELNYGFMKGSRRDLKEKKFPQLVSRLDMEINHLSFSAFWLAQRFRKPPSRDSVGFS
ncbi:MAG: hypothetical protein AB9866_12790 [Syntrophobacteraceae bacterium]